MRKGTAAQAHLQNKWSCSIEIDTWKLGEQVNKRTASNTTFVCYQFRICIRRPSLLALDVLDGQGTNNKHSNERTTEIREKIEEEASFD